MLWIYRDCIKESSYDVIVVEFELLKLVNLLFKCLNQSVKQI